MAKQKNLVTNPIFINNYSNALLHKRKAKTEFNSVSFRHNGKWASFALPLGMCKPATRRDGSIIDGCSNLFLGAANKTHNVSIRNADGTYETFEMTNKEIQNSILASREEYQAATA